ncbi:TetR/AcrR family transcriptional regulator [Billgrantia bachuensis]|uniref:TetR/AcrR family transcriptional regulator n=1 Tax=Billgrantia bachuensis TaxID=2717286 RepID=A0ABX0PT46_9GAMM|nr:TetR/AcrR family transcriptional regulator [Halomonas bachuensis]NIC06574.1 TetR/AcrR family transcriptional regulator [Halomonas bachuensis]
MQNSTREQIITAADDLFYRQGFEQTSFANIAEAVGISRGNFYYHFKTKDEILKTVIQRRLANTRDMLDQWEAESSGPVERIRSFVRILIGNRGKIMRHGCPVGTLCAELAKLEHLQRDAANEVMTLFRTWLHRQFVALGHEADADALAMHLLARSQGIALVANAYQDSSFVDAEVEQLLDWLDACVAQSTHAE